MGKRNSYRSEFITWNITRLEWFQLCESLGFACACCGATPGFKHLTRDHIVPLSKGGGGELDNCQPLCRQCASEKGDHHSTDYRSKALRRLAAAR